MQITLRDAGELRELEAQEGMTVLDVLQRSGVVVDAPCGGAGTCKKCRMLIADDEGVSYRLACQVPVSEGLEVTVERNRAMSVSMGDTDMLWHASGEDEGYGVAIDVGTTTVVCRLYDLHDGSLLGAVGTSNPQLAFGADVISRISCVENGGLESMCTLLGDALVSMVDDVLKQNKLKRSDVKRATLCGNTVMQHIAAFLDPTPIGVSPFTPESLFGTEITYAPFEAAGIADGRVLFATCVAGYVGGDITCGMLAEDMRHSDKPVVFLDLGTNGEMALGANGSLISCATAAGPVFEGANVKYGMPAYPGAISKVYLGDDGDIQLEVIGDAEPIGICGTGLIDAIALLLECGIVSDTGRMCDDDEEYTDTGRRLAHRLIEEDDTLAFKLTDRISVTQKDVRSLQLAKASVCAGVMTMLDVRGIKPEEVGSLLIAGGFGEYLNLANAAAVGIFPEELLDRAKSVGNTAIEGAAALLLSGEARDEIAAIMEATEYIELSGHMLFNTLYVEQMSFE